MKATRLIAESKELRKKSDDLIAQSIALCEKSKTLAYEHLASMDHDGEESA